MPHLSKQFLAGALCPLLLVGCGQTAPSRPAESNATAANQPLVAEAQTVTPASTLDPLLAEARTAIAREDWTRAERALRSITEARADLPNPWFDLGLVQAKQGQFDAAAQSLETAIELDAQFVAAHNLLGVVYRNLGRIEESRAAYERALAIDAEYAPAHFNAAILFDIYLQDPARALAHYRRYQALSPAPDAQVTQWISQLEAQYGH